MDTAVAIIPRSSARALAAFLTERLPAQSEPWLVVLNGEPVIFLNIVPAEEADLEPTDLPHLQERLGQKELTALLADVAVRNVGCQELRDLVAAVLTRFSGLASDDVAERWWTSEEIQEPRKFNLQPFWPHEVKSPILGPSSEA